MFMPVLIMVFNVARSLHAGPIVQITPVLRVFCGFSEMRRLHRCEMFVVAVECSELECDDMTE